MSHYEERLEQDLNQIRERMRVLSEQAQEAVGNALRSVLGGNRKLAYATILGDARINRGMREIDSLCHRFIVRHLPSAGHLRLMSASMRVIAQLERIGDYAVTICREGVQLSAPPEGPIARELELTADQATQMLRQAAEAFNEGNAEKARATVHLGESMESALDAIYDDWMSDTDRDRFKDLLALFVMFNLVKRISDQAKNLCEETLFAVAGETKEERVHDILFIDEENRCLGQMAEAIGRGTYPDNGRFASAGRQAAEAVDPGLVTFMDGHGYDLSGARPTTLDSAPEALSRYFVIVVLEGAVKSYVDRVPFHCSVLEWDVGSAPDRLTGEEATRRYEELYRQLSLHVRDLVETLRGEEAG